MGKFDPLRYVGAAGVLALMSEFAWRGYNVAIPEIDVGDDIYVINDRTGMIWRIQVKTATGKRQIQSMRYQFMVSRSSIEDEVTTPEIHFVFTIKDSVDAWRFVFIRRAELNMYVHDHGIGSAQQRSDRISEVLVFTFTLHDDNRFTARHGGRLDLTRHLDNWTSWPILLQTATRRTAKSRAEESHSSPPPSAN